MYYLSQKRFLLSSMISSISRITSILCPEILSWYTTPPPQKPKSQATHLLWQPPGVWHHLELCFQEACQQSGLLFPSWVFLVPVFSVSDWFTETPPGILQLPFFSKKPCVFSPVFRVRYTFTPWAISANIIAPFSLPQNQMIFDLL